MRSLGKTVHQRYRQVQYQGIFVGRSVLKVPRTRLQKPRTNAKINNCAPPCDKKQNTKSSKIIFIGIRIIIFLEYFKIYCTRMFTYDNLLFFVATKKKLRFVITKCSHKKLCPCRCGALEF